MSGAIYAPVGPWWTLDAPSLRLPTRDGQQVSVWTVGEGPSVLLVPRTDSDHRAWLPLLPHLQDRFTLHALQWTSSAATGAAARDVAVAVEGLGVRQIVADGDAGGAVLTALAGNRLSVVLVVHAGAVPAGTGPDSSVVVRGIGRPEDRLDEAPALLAARIADALAG
jgi:hypothetical protein